MQSLLPNLEKQPPNNQQPLSVEAMAVRTMQRLRKLFPSAKALRSPYNSPIRPNTFDHQQTPRQFIAADVEDFMREALVERPRLQFPKPPFRLETPLIDVEIDPHMRGLNE